MEKLTIPPILLSLAHDRGVMERARAVTSIFAPAHRVGNRKNGDTAMIGMTSMSMIRKHGVKVAALAVVGMGLFLGGCNKDIKEKNAELTTENATLREKNAAAESENAAMKQQMEMLRAQNTQRDTGPITITQTGGGGNGGGAALTPKKQSGETTIITVAGDVLFMPGSATLKPEAKKELDGLVKTIKTQHTARSIRVEGYTDSDPIKKSKWPSNEALSQARAEAVRDYLANKGISSSRLTAVGMGAAKPKANKKDSRRVEVVIVDN